MVQTTLFVFITYAKSFFFLSIFFLIFKFFFLEILKFNKKEDKVEGMFDKCLFVLRNLSSFLSVCVRCRAVYSTVFSRLPRLRNSLLGSLVNIGENLKSFRDWYSVMSTQLKKGREEDPKEELEKGL